MIAIHLTLLPMGVLAAIRVPEDALTISDALLLAAPFDTVLVAPGTYQEDLNLPTGVILRGDGALGTVIIEGSGTTSVVTCQTTVAGTRLEQVVIRNGAGVPAGSFRSGGGVFVQQGELNMKNVRVENNSGDFGGGVFLEDAKLHWNGGALQSNQGMFGGGLFARRGEVHLSGLQILDNRGSRGGGLYGTDVELVNLDTSHWELNQATELGGAIYLETSAAVCSQSRFEDNQASISGGAWHVDQSSMATISYTIFYDNLAGTGGGSVFVTCQGAGGSGCSSVELDHVDLIANRGPAAAAGAVDGAGSLTLVASVIAGNESSLACLDSRAILDIQCSAAFGNGSSTPDACTPTVQDTLVVDPYLCDLPSGDLKRCSNSPLLSPAACGLPYLGALAGGCTPCVPTPTRATSWGRLKTRYR